MFTTSISKISQKVCTWGNQTIFRKSPFRPHDKWPHKLALPRLHLAQSIPRKTVVASVSKANDRLHRLLICVTWGNLACYQSVSPFLVWYFAWIFMRFTRQRSASLEPPWTEPTTSTTDNSFSFNPHTQESWVIGDQLFSLRFMSIAPESPKERQQSIKRNSFPKPFSTYDRSAGRA